MLNHLSFAVRVSTSNLLSFIRDLKGISRIFVPNDPNISDGQ